MISKTPLHECGRWRQAAALLLLVLVLLASLTGWASAGSSDQPSETQNLVDRWVRPDGGYILELREFRNDGSLVAAYFNKKSINVSRAGWRLAKEGVDVFVELRDVNYPGSIYTLHYDPVTDRMQGIYFQAVQRQSYEVIFIRSH